MVDGGVRLRPARRRLCDRLVDAAAEEEPRHRRARARKAGRLIGDLAGFLATLKGLPLAYNRDLQEDKEPLFDAIDVCSLSLAALTGLLATVEFVDTAMTAAADSPVNAATDLAEHLVEEGTPFREAHAIVGSLVRQVGRARRSARRARVERSAARTRVPRPARTRERGAAAHDARWRWSRTGCGAARTGEGAPRAPADVARGH